MARHQFVFHGVACHLPAIFSLELTPPFMKLIDTRHEVPTRIFVLSLPDGISSFPCRCCRAVYDSNNNALYKSETVEVSNCPDTSPMLLRMMDSAVSEEEPPTPPSGFKKKRRVHVIQNCAFCWRRHYAPAKNWYPVRLIPELGGLLSTGSSSITPAVAPSPYHDSGLWNVSATHVCSTGNSAVAHAISRGDMSPMVLKTLVAVGRISAVDDDCISMQSDSDTSTDHSDDASSVDDVLDDMQVDHDGSSAYVSAALHGFALRGIMEAQHLHMHSIFSPHHLMKEIAARTTLQCVHHQISLELKRVLVIQSCCVLELVCIEGCKIQLSSSPNLKSNLLEGNMLLGAGFLIGGCSGVQMQAILSALLQNNVTVSNFSRRTHRQLLSKAFVTRSELFFSEVEKSVLRLVCSLIGERPIHMGTDVQHQYAARSGVQSDKSFSSCIEYGTYLHFVLVHTVVNRLHHQLSSDGAEQLHWLLNSGKLNILHEYIPFMIGRIIVDSKTSVIKQISADIGISRGNANTYTAPVPVDVSMRVPSATPPRGLGMGGIPIESYAAERLAPKVWLQTSAVSKDIKHKTTKISQNLKRIVKDSVLETWIGTINRFWGYCLEQSDGDGSKFYTLWHRYSEFVREPTAEDVADENGIERFRAFMVKFVSESDAHLYCHGDSNGMNERIHAMVVAHIAKSRKFGFEFYQFCCSVVVLRWNMIRVFRLRDTSLPLPKAASDALDTLRDLVGSAEYDWIGKLMDDMLE